MDAELFKQLQITQLILNAARILPSQDDADFALFLGSLDVGCLVDLKDNVGIVAKALLPFDDVVDGVPEILPNRAGAVSRSQTASSHVFQDASSEIRDNEAIDHDGVLVQLRG